MDEAPQSVLVADGYARVRSDVDLCREMLEREWEGKQSNQSNLSVRNVHGKSPVPTLEGHAA